MSATAGESSIPGRFLFLELHSLKVGHRGSLLPTRFSRACSRFFCAAIPSAAQAVQMASQETSAHHSDAEIAMSDCGRQQPERTSGSG
jgi:hypothetical protein